MALSHKKLASWYLQLAQSQDAGLPLADSLRSSAEPPASDLLLMASQIESGETIDQVLRKAPRWLPKADRYFISTAAATGRLPQTFRNLSERHERIGSNKMKMVLSCLYPLGVFHVGACLLPITSTVDFENGFSFDAALYITALLKTLVPLWAVIATLLILVKRESPIISKLMRMLPILRAYSKNQALASFSHALGAFLDAGLNIDKSWAGAALVANDPTLQKATQAIRKTIDAGGSPADEMAKHSCFPTDFKALYKTGERTGKLDHNLMHLGIQFQEKANRMMTLSAMVYPSILFFAVVVMVVINILQFYGQYLKSITDIMEG